MKKLLLITLFPLFLQAELVDAIAILVKNDPITLYEIKQAQKEMKVDQAKVVDALIRKKLEEQEAKERGISASSAEIYADMEKMAQQNNMSVMQLYDAMQSARGLSEKQFKAKIKDRILNQKLYNAIAFSQIQEPTSAEEEEYYYLHVDKFTHPQSFKVIIYNSKEKEALETKINNPMFYSVDVTSEEADIQYKTINPRLAEILNETEAGKFSPILPSPDGGHMSFYVKDKLNTSTQALEDVRPQINASIMADKREQILKEYFARLKLNAEIKILRLP